MRQYLLILAATVFGLTGCVTQSTYSGTNIPVLDREFNAENAAKGRIQLAVKYMEAGNMEQAKFNINRALSHDPNLIDAHLTLAYYLERVGELSSAEKSYKKALSINGGNGDAMHNYGGYLCRQKRYAEAEKMFLDAVKQKRYTNMANTYENLGICAVRAGKKTKAKQYFETVINYNQRKPTSLLALIRLQVEDADFTSAKTNLLLFNRFMSSNPASLLLTAKTEAGLGNKMAEIQAVQELISQFPESVEAQEYNKKAK